ncbi:MAG: FHA domain-containing protein [Phototrophicaceae bacterium]
MGYLIMRRGPYPGRVYRLDADEISIGRGNRNTIIIRDNEVSREHLRLTRVDDGFEIVDNDSSNGTFVDGQPLEGTWTLYNPVMIELGDSISLEYWPGEPDEAAISVRAQAAPPLQSQAYLIVTVHSDDQPAVYPLTAVASVVGRANHCEIVIVEPEVSREHFRITLTPRGYVVDDLGSTNGTYVNGRRLEDSYLLQPGDVLQIGTTVFFQLTHTPERHTGKARTDHLHDTERLDDNVRRRRQGFATAPATSGIGTGVDNVSLIDQVLVTYARDEWEQVAPLVDYLLGAGLGVWVDQYLAEGSQDWLTAVEQARLECWLLVVIVSPRALRSEVVQRNWRHFHSREKPIVLYVQQPVERLPIGAERLDFVEHNPTAPAITFQQLVDRIRRNL